MASRPGIRTLNNTGYNTIGRPTSPAADRGSGVKQINPALAGSKERTQVLATGRRGKPPQRVSLATAATAAGTVLTQGAQNLLDAGREGFENLTDAVKRIFPENVPLVEIPGINQPLRENAPPIVEGTQNIRNELLSSGGGDDGAKLPNPGKALGAAGTVITNTMQELQNTFNKGVQTAFPNDVPLVDIRGINKPIVDNPSQLVGGFIKTSKYSPDLVTEAKVRASKGDVVSGLYAATADGPLVKGVRDLYERVQGPGYTPASQSMSGVLLAGGNFIASVPAALQTINFLNNPNRMAYTKDLPKSISGVQLDAGLPNISADRLTITVDDVETVDTVLGAVATSAGELARQEIPRFIEGVKQEFIDNPYGLAGQIVGGAVLAKGVSGAVPKRVKVRGIEGEPAVKPKTQTVNDRKQTRPTKEDAQPWVTAEYTIKASARDAVIRNLPKIVRRINQRDSMSYGYVSRTNSAQKAAGLAGAGAVAEIISGSDAERTLPIPQRVATVSYTKVEAGDEGIVTRLPTKKDDVNGGGVLTRLPSKSEELGGEGVVTRLPTKKEDVNGSGVVTRLPTKKEDVTKDEIVTRLPSKISELNSEQIITRLPSKQAELMRSGELTSNRTKRQTAVKEKEKSQNKNREEYSEANRTQNRVREEFAYEYATATSPRGNRGKRRIDIDINLPRKVKGTKKRRVRKYAKRQIVNPIPWLWDEEPGFAADIPKEVEMVSISTLLA